MQPQTLIALKTHAASEYPRECCGLVVIAHGKERYWPCRNLAATPDAQFIIDPVDYYEAEDAGDIVAIAHSHPNIAPRPSEADLTECERSGLPWIIINWPTGDVHEFAPSGYKAPLIGREFHHGVLDCYTIIRDYYRETLGIMLPDFERRDDWWKKGENLYLDNFHAAGFTRVDDLRVHDVILIQIEADRPNHAAIYLGEQIILHHVQNRLSCRDVYGGYWLKNTWCYLRHEALA